MLSDSIFQQAEAQLRNHITCVELLKEIWPLVKNHDFEETKNLSIPKPRHLSNDNEAKLVPYSHKTIRRTFKALKLKPIKITDKQFIHVTVLKNTTKKRKKRK